MLGRLEFIATAGRSIVLEFHNTNKTPSSNYIPLPN
jgi:hypothetical protein